MILKRPARERASVLTIALMLCLIVGTMLAAALGLTSHRHKLAVHSSQWSAALVVAEAGIEEAMTQWQRNRSSLSADGWTATNVAGQTLYSKTRLLEGDCYFQASLYASGTNEAVVYSAGFVPAPLQHGTYISRLVKVTAKPPREFGGVAAIGKITLSGNPLVDGYDSSVGPYNAVTNHNASVELATDSQANPAIDIKGATVCGQVACGPGGSVDIGSGTVGDLDWTASSTGIQPGASDDDMNVAFPTNAPPSPGPFLGPLVTSGHGSNVIFLGTITNKMASLTLNSVKDPVIVTGKAALWITGDLDITGNGYIYIAPGASLTLYVGGAAKIAGGGVINGDGRPQNFSFVGLSSSKDLTYTGGADFIGTINAPQAAVTVKGTAGVYGAAICNSFYCSGNGGFHYDISLGKPLVTSAVAMTWTEL